MQSTESSCQKKRLIIVFYLLTAGAAAAVALLLRTPVFETNDDVMLKAIASGDITGTPDAHLVYIMYPMGMLLKLIYNVFPSMPCYDIFMTGLRIAVFMVITLRAGLSGKNTKQGILFSLLASTATIAADVSYLWVGQYTPLAGLTAAAAVFILASSDAIEGAEYWIERIAVVILLVISLNLRKQAMLLLMPVVVLTIAYKAIGAWGRDRKIIPRGAVWIATLALLAGASLLADKAAYSSDEWKEFLKYNNERTDIYDYYQVPAYADHKEEYDAMGINETDMYPLAEYDLELFDEALKPQMGELSAMAESSWKSQRQGSWLVKSICKDLIDYAVGIKGSRLNIAVTVAVLAVVIWAGPNGKRKFALLALALFVYQEAASAYFLYRQRFPERVSHCLYLGVFLCILGCVFSRDIWDTISRKRTLAVSLGVCLAVVMTVTSALSVGEALSKREDALGACEEWDTMNAYFAQNEDKIFLIKTNSFSSYGEKMFTLNTHEGRNALRMGTWICESPHYDKQTERLGIEDIAQSLESGRELYWVQDSSVPEELMNDFWSGRYKNVSSELFDTVELSENKSVSIYKLTAE